MQKIPCILLLITLVFPASLRAIDRYKAGDTLHVWAVSGLILRDGPSIAAKKITTIPYGSGVAAMRNKYFKDSDYSVRIQERSFWCLRSGSSDSVFLPEVRLWGQWALVRYQGREGYVFDGYLSLRPAVNIKFRETKDPKLGTLRWHDPEPIKSYLCRYFKLVDSLDRRTGDTEYSDHIMRTVYEHGILIEDRRLEKSGESVWVLPDFTLEEAYLLLNVYNHLDYHLNTESKEDKAQFISWGPNGFIIGMYGCDWQVSVLGGVCVIFSTCSC